MNTRRRIRRGRGFTLLEVMMVLVILVVLASMTVPLLDGTLRNQELRSSADTIRAEWMDARIKAMEEGQILCLRGQLGGRKWILDRILDAHFTASLSSRETSRRFDLEGEADPFEKGAFTGEATDYILRDPNLASEENGARFLALPESVFVADLIAVPDERAAFYLGLTSPGEQDVEENSSESEEIANQELRLGETAGSDGTTWSAPIFFYPDGTTSSAAVLLKNDRGKCVEIRLRGLTGIGKVCDTSSVETYTGDLDASRERSDTKFDFHEI